MKLIKWRKTLGNIKNTKLFSQTKISKKERKRQKEVMRFVKMDEKIQRETETQQKKFLNDLERLNNMDNRAIRTRSKESKAINTHD